MPKLDVGRMYIRNEPVNPRIEEGVMKKKVFKRLGKRIVSPEEQFVKQVVYFGNGALLEVQDGTPYRFRLKFSPGEGKGWWVDPDCIDQLIAELLYIRKDLRNYVEVVDMDEMEGDAEEEF